VKKLTIQKNDREILLKLPEENFKLTWDDDSEFVFLNWEDDSRGYGIFYNYE
jgi:hypothetical protein